VENSAGPAMSALVRLVADRLGSSNAVVRKQACKEVLDGGGTNSFWDGPASLNVAASGGNPLHPLYEGAIGLWVQAALYDLIASACEFRVARFVWPIRDQSPSKTGLHARHALLERFEHGCHDAGDGNAHEP